MTTAPHQTTLNSLAAPEDDELQALDAYWRTAKYLAVGMIDRVDSLGSRAAHVKERMKDEIQKHRAYAYTHGMDAPEINNWRWTFGHS